MRFPLSLFKRTRPKSATSAIAGELARLARVWSLSPRRRIDATPRDVRGATERYLLFFLLPAWLIPGVVDYFLHKKTRIEQTSGTKESLIHALMMTEVGIPVVLGLLLEIDPPVLALMFANAVGHEATAFWDVQTAIDGHREVKPNEQHVHSFLEILPLTAVSFMTCLHWDSFLGMIGVGERRGDWRLRLKKERLPAGYLAFIGAAIAATLALPYGEELVRCMRAERARKAAELESGRDSTTITLTGQESVDRMLQAVI